MNPQPVISPTALLFAGEVFDGSDEAHPLMKCVDGSSVAVRVRVLSARHLITPNIGYIDLRDRAMESEVLQLCVQRLVKAENTAAPSWVPADENFVDNLDDASHTTLLDVADKLNFKRAVSQAERQIATGNSLLGLKEKMAKVMMAPTQKELESWISSASSRISEALAQSKR